MKNLNKKISSQLGINMVDLMMWLVIAALLLAAALQGIGYYQKASYLYSMKNDASNAGSAVMAQAANDGKITDDVVTTGTNETKKTTNVNTVGETGASDAAGFVIRSTSPSVEDSDVVFLSKQRGAWAPGVHVVPKGTVIAPDGGTTIVTPPDSGGSGGGGGGGPIIDETQIMSTSWITTGSNCSIIKLPIAGIGNGTTVDWGDGNGPQPVTTDYPSKDFTGIATNTGNIVVDGTFTRFGASNNWSASCVTSIDSWGDATGTTSMADAFYAVSDLKLTSLPRIPSSITNIADVFAETNFNGDVSNWDTSNVTDMSYAFGTSVFNGDISNWDTSKVTSMNCMFCDNKVFNQDISGWKTGAVTNFGNMFAGAHAFNQDIGNWDTSSATRMAGMFKDTKAFNQDISGWNTSNVLNMQQMFEQAIAFDSPLVQTPEAGGWDTSKVIYFHNMFHNATAFNQNISSWNVSSGTNFSSMFENASSFNQNITSWKASAATAWNFSTGSALAPENLPNS